MRYPLLRQKLQTNMEKQKHTTVISEREKEDPKVDKHQ